MPELILFRIITHWDTSLFSNIVSDLGPPGHQLLKMVAKDQEFLSFFYSKIVTTVFLNGN